MQHRMLGLVVWVSLILCLIPSPATAQRFGIEDVLRMVKAGVSDSVIMAQIESRGSAFYLSTEELLALKKAGASDQLLLAMIASWRRTAAPSLPSQVFRPYPLPLWGPISAAPILPGGSVIFYHPHSRLHYGFHYHYQHGFHYGLHHHQMRPRIILRFCD